MPQPTRPQQYCDPASLVQPLLFYFISFPLVLSFTNPPHCTIHRFHYCTITTIDSSVTVAVEPDVVVDIVTTIVSSVAVTVAVGARLLLMLRWQKR